MPAAESHLAPDHLAKLGRVMARAWADPSFKDRLKAEPTTVLAENGITIRPGVAIEVVENTPEKSYLTIPTPKAPIGASEDEIEEIARSWQVASGSSSCFTCSPC